MKVFKLAFIFLSLLMCINCDKPNRFTGVGVPVTPQIQPQFPLNQQALVLQACQFYKAQSLILNCNEEKDFFNVSLQNERNIIASVCLKQAFSSVWGTNFSPSPYLYDPEANKSSNFNWHFRLGNIQKGSASAFPPNAIEIQYLQLLDQFKQGVDANQLNQCLGGNYPHTSPIIFSTALGMIKLGHLEPEVFFKCYKDQLEAYRIKNSCPL